MVGRVPEAGSAITTERHRPLIRRWGAWSFAEIGASKLRDVYRQTGVSPVAAQHDVTIQQDLPSDKELPAAYRAAAEPPVVVAPAQKAKLIAAGRPEN